MYEKKSEGRFLHLMISSSDESAFAINFVLPHKRGRRRYEMSFIDRIKESVKESLDRMAESNSKNYGNGPSCCTMNRNENIRASQNIKKGGE